MAKYTGDANLISGAAAAYRNYDNAPGMYDGLDKIGESAQDALKVIKAEKAKAELEKEAEEKKKTDQDAAWYKAAGGAYENAGSFQKDVEYKSTVSALNDLQPRWVAAMDGGTAEEKAAVSLEYNNIRDEINDHKAFREEITDPEYGLSDALSNSGVVGGNDARDKTFLTALIAEEYEVSNNDEGEKVYTVDGVSKTMSEIKDMAVLKDAVPFTAYEQTRDKRGGAKKFDRQGTEFDIRTNVVPKDFNKLRAFVSDAGHGSGENLADLLRKDKKGITGEIDKTLFDANGDNKISDDEFEQFIQAVVDPYHATWENDDGTHDKNKWQKHTTNIAIERLANGVENTHGENYPATASSEGGDGFQYGFDDPEGEVITDVNDPNYVATGPVSSTIFDLINVDDDDDASENLNAKLGLVASGKKSVLSDVAFAPYTMNIRAMPGTNNFSPDAGLSNDIMIYNPKTGDHYRDENREVIRFNTGDDAFVELGDGEENPTGLRIMEELEKLGVDTSKIDAKVDTTKMSDEQIDNLTKTLKGE